MFHHSSKLQYPVRVEKPDPEFAMLLQQAIGGVEGEIRVAMQYFFQAMGARGDARIRDLLISTATEELGHIEMLGNGIISAARPRYRTAALIIPLRWRWP